MKQRSKLALFVVIAGFSLSPALAQNAPATPPPSSATPAAPAMTKAHSPQSIECSKEADAQGVHGPKRKKFR